MLCFPLDGQDREQNDIQDHVRSSLDRLVIKRPESGGKPAVTRRTSAIQLIYRLGSLLRTVSPLGTVNLNLHSTYAELCDNSFFAVVFADPGMFVSGSLISNGPIMAVAQVRLLYVEGDLLLFVYPRHAFGNAVAWTLA